MKFLAALQFLTIFPVRRDFSPEEIGQSLGYFPIVGLILGLVLAGLSWLLDLLLPVALVDILLIVTLVVATGALHLDGLLDACDGIAAHKTPQERLDVMRDSRAGAFGVIGACCLLLLKYISLTTMPESARMAALVLMPVLGRWGTVYAVFAYPYATRHGVGRIFKEQGRWRDLALATITALFVAVVLGRFGGLVVMFGIWITVITMAAYLGSRFGGLTGDTYGAITEVTETSVLIIVSLFVRNHWFWAWP